MNERTITYKVKTKDDYTGFSLDGTGAKLFKSGYDRACKEHKIKDGDCELVSEVQKPFKHMIHNFTSSDSIENKIKQTIDDFEGDSWIEVSSESWRVEEILWVYEERKIIELCERIKKEFDIDNFNISISNDSIIDDEKRINYKGFTVYIENDKSEELKLKIYHNIIIIMIDGDMKIIDGVVFYKVEDYIKEFYKKGKIND